MVIGHKRYGQKEGILGNDSNGIIAAAKKNSLKMAARALEINPDAIVETEAETGNTAMHIAVARGNGTMVQFLLQQPRVDITIKNKNGLDPLDLAIRLRHNQGVTDELFRFRAIQLGLDGSDDPEPSSSAPNVVGFKPDKPSP
jgi:hypothetical protein